MARSTQRRQQHRPLTSAELDAQRIAQEWVTEAKPSNAGEDSWIARQWLSEMRVVAEMDSVTLESLRSLPGCEQERVEDHEAIAHLLTVDVHPDRDDVAALRQRLLQEHAASGSDDLAALRSELLRPKPKPGDPNTLAAVFLDADPGAGPAEARRRAKVWADHLHVTPDDVCAWFAAGLGPVDLQLVADLTAHDITPELLSTRLRGETMLDRIQIRNYSLQQVIRTLQNANLWPHRPG